MCTQSSPEGGLRFSDEYFRFIIELKKFNYRRIYAHWRIEEFMHYASDIIKTLYEVLMRVQPYAQNGRAGQALRYYPSLCITYEDWLVKYANYAPLGHPDKKRILRCNTADVFDINDNESYQKCVIEYISGMTDQFAIQVYEEIITF